MFNLVSFCNEKAILKINVPKSDVLNDPIHKSISDPNLLCKEINLCFNQLLTYESGPFLVNSRDIFLAETISKNVILKAPSTTVKPLSVSTGEHLKKSKRDFCDIFASRVFSLYFFLGGGC